MRARALPGPALEELMVMARAVGPWTWCAGRSPGSGSAPDAVLGRHGERGGGMDSAEWDRRYSATGLLWTASPNRFVVAELTGLAPGRALDLGCGEGRNAIWLAEQGWQVSAVDFSAVGLDKARRLAGERGVTVDWVSADLRDYQPRPAAFDLVLLAYLHLPPGDWAAVLHSARD